MFPKSSFFFEAFEGWMGGREHDKFFLKILVGISATMCHSAEKIPAKEGFLSKSANMFK